MINIKLFKVIVITDRKQQTVKTSKQWKMQHLNVSGQQIFHEIFKKQLNISKD